MEFTKNLVRVTWLIQLVLGLLIWFGLAKSVLRPIHMTNGIIFTVALIVLAVLAVRMKAPMGLVVFTIAWAVLTAAFGMSQREIMKGDGHWVIQVLHLLVGIAAGVLGDRLASVAAAKKTVAPA